VNSLCTTSFFGLIRDYLIKYLPENRLCSQATVISYRTTINQLLDYMEQSEGVDITSLTFDDFTTGTITGFIGWLSTVRKVSVTTCNQKLSAVKAFFSYSAMRDPSLRRLSDEMSRIRRLRSNVKPPEIMSETAYRAILEQADTEDRIGKRNLFILIMLFETGMRVSELLGVTLGDISGNDRGGAIAVVGKGGKGRSAVYGKEVARYLNNYLAAFHDTPSPQKTPLVYTVHRGEKTFMSADTPQKFIKAYADRARIQCPEVPQSVHPHSFRHLRASTLYQQGIPLSIIARLLGHASVDTTSIYASADIEMLRSAVEGKYPDYQFLSDAVLPEESSEIIRKISGLQL